MLTCERRDIIAEARRWIGTPYHHQASLRGVGADCLGLVRGVWRSLHGFEAEAPPAYSRDWAEASGEETLLGAAAKHLVPIEIADMQPGDILIFRYRPNVPAKHAGILVTADTFVHAMEGAAACEVPLGPWWRRRIAGVFAFRGVT
jgi:NlpC/P60 family putative phage cell wall peptidase